jgi:hypothetical protein
MDVILTDLGRQRLAQAFSSTQDFDIVQFACSDDDIDYSVFDEVGVNGVTFEDVVAKVVRRQLVFEPASAGSTQSRSKLIRVPLNALSTITKLPVYNVTPGLQISMVAGSNIQITLQQDFQSQTVQPSLIDDSFIVEFNSQLIRLVSGGQSSSADLTVDSFRNSTTRFVATRISPTEGSTLTMRAYTVFNNFATQAARYGVTGNSLKTHITVTGKNSGLSKTIELTITNS